MSDFTMPLGEAIDTMGGQAAFERAALSDYDIFDEEYRPILNDRIVQHFWFREIGYETIDQFNWGVRNEMRESAPIFNAVYRALDDFKLHPGWTTNLKSVSTGHVKGTGENTSESQTDGTNKTGSTSYASNYEMPNTRLTAGEDYMSNAAKNQAESVGETSAKTTGKDSSNNSTDSSSESATTGWQGLPSDIIMGIVTAMTSGDKEVFRILDKHFMGVWNGGQCYWPGGWGAYWAWPYAGIF